MIRASNIVIIYFVVGAVMFGGGAVTWDDSGLTKYFIDNEDGVEPADQAEGNLLGVDNALTNLVNTFSGAALLVWNLFAGLVGYIHWPLFVFIDSGAPPRVTILLGGTPTVAFYMAAIRLVTSSA